jgi:tetratricopeptide (TPR) repeat protein
LAIAILLDPMGFASPVKAQEPTPEPTPYEAPAPEADPPPQDGTPGSGETDPMAAAGVDMDDEIAQNHFRTGRSLYDAGRFAQAAREFEEAYRLSERPLLLYNIYVAHRDANNFPAAVEALRKFLELVPDAEGRVGLEARLRQMEETVRQQEAADAELQAAREPDGEPAETTPAPAEASPEPERAGFGVLPWIIGGIGVAAVLTGTVTGFVALSSVSDLEDSCPNDRCPVGFDLEGERSDARTLVTLTDVLLISGAVVTTAAALMLLLDPASNGERDPGAEGVDVAAACTTSGCGLSLTTGF